MKETIKKELEQTLTKQGVNKKLFPAMVTLATAYWKAGFQKYHKLLRDKNIDKIEEYLKEFAIE